MGIRRLVAAVISVAAVGVSTSGSAQQRIVWVGETTPWVELLRAELALLNVSVEPAHAPVPLNDDERLERIHEWDAIALVVSPEDAERQLAQLWATDCDGVLRSHGVATRPSPGQATVIMAELVWAHLQDCAEREVPNEPATEPTESTPRAMASASSLSVPVSTPRIAAARPVSAASRSGLRAREEPAPRNARRTLEDVHPGSSLARPPPELDVEDDEPVITEKRTHYPIRLSTGVSFGSDDMSLVAPAMVFVDASVDVHRHLAFGVGSRVGYRSRTNEPIRDAWSGATDLDVRVLIPIRGARLELVGGPTLLWVRGRFNPNLGVSPDRAFAPGYHFGLFFDAELTDRVGVRLGAQVTRGGRRSLRLGPRELGRLGPLPSAQLALRFRI
ncbi:MAG: hypothetical protein AAGE52_15335 [Myxococcota bacterium]